jgi:AcrR family transcriptional regulator
MTTSRRVIRRDDWRRNATRLALIEAAETLFAQRGIDTVSLREIGEAAGSGNNNVVGYHFGGKDELVGAIFEHRLPWLDARRAERLGMVSSDDLGGLLNALWRPLYEQVNSEGDHSYAGFLAALLEGERGAMRRVISELYPATEALVRQIRACVSVDAQPQFDHRLRVSALIVTGTLRMIDQDRGDSEALFADAVRMATAAMGAAGPGDATPQDDGAL